MQLVCFAGKRRQTRLHCNPRSREKTQENAVSETLKFQRRAGSVTKPEDASVRWTLVDLQRPKKLRMGLVRSGMEAVYFHLAPKGRATNDGACLRGTRMNIGASVAANVATHAAISAAMVRRGVVDHFEKAGALTSETAVPIPAKFPRAAVKALIKRGALVEAGGELFYLDKEANARSLREQAKVGMAVVIGLVVVLGLVIGALVIGGVL